MKRSLFIVLLMPVFGACHSLIKDDELYKHDKTPVLNAVLQPDSLIKVSLHYSSSLKENGFTPVENAQVIIHSPGKLTDTLTYEKEGVYVSKFKAYSSCQYNCVANIPDYPSLSASTTVPYITGMENIRLQKKAGTGVDGEMISSVSFSIQNNRDKPMFWEVKLKNEYHYFDMSIQKDIFDIMENEIIIDADRDEVLRNEALPLSVFSNEKITGPDYTVLFYFSEYYASYDDLYVEFNSLDESCYKYQKRLFLYNTSGGTGLGTSPGAYKLYSNIENGLGIFTSFASVSQQIFFE